MSIWFFPTSTVIIPSQEQNNWIATEISQWLRDRSRIQSQDKKFLNLIPYDIASKQEISSTSMVEVATKDCFALFPDTIPPANMKMYPYVDLGEST